MPVLYSVEFRTLGSPWFFYKTYTKAGSARDAARHGHRSMMIKEPTWRSIDEWNVGWRLSPNKLLDKVYGLNDRDQAKALTPTTSEIRVIEIDTGNHDGLPIVTQNITHYTRLEPQIDALEGLIADLREQIEERTGEGYLIRQARQQFAHGHDREQLLNSRLAKLEEQRTIFVTWLGHFERHLDELRAALDEWAANLPDGVARGRWRLR